MHSQISALVCHPHIHDTNIPGEPLEHKDHILAKAVIENSVEKKKATKKKQQQQKQADQPVWHATEMAQNAERKQTKRGIKPYLTAFKL